MTTLLMPVYAADSSPDCIFIATDSGLTALAGTAQNTDTWNMAIKDRTQVVTLLGDGPPTDAQGWLDLMSFNMGQHTFGDPIPVPDGENANTAAKKLLSDSQGVPDSHIPDLALAKSAYDQTQTAYPHWPEQDDPEAELEYRKISAGSVDPENLHFYVPDYTGALNCTWCDRLQKHPLHY